MSLALEAQPLIQDEKVDCIFVSKPRVVQSHGKVEVVFSVNVGAESHSIWFRTDKLPNMDYSNAALAMTLLPAMTLNLPLKLEGAISPQLLRGVNTIQEIYHSWYENYYPIEISAQAVATTENRAGRGVACFFSGGVDSFNTLLKCLEEIDSVILIHGFDFHRDFPAREEVVQNAKSVASKFGKSLIEVETNARDFGDQHVTWLNLGGAMLGAVALLLSGNFRKIFIPSSFSYGDLKPGGSHPLVDPLWSTENFEIIHDDCETERIEKVARLVRNETALAYLRVCWENEESSYNCGKCEKCLRTMIALAILGALEKCKKFLIPLDLRRVARIDVNNESAQVFVSENLKAARKWNASPELVQALQESASALYLRSVWGWPRRGVNFMRRKIFGHGGI